MPPSPVTDLMAFVSGSFRFLLRTFYVAQVIQPCLIPDTRVHERTIPWIFGQTEALQA
jgi:hypothetical protein